MQHPERSLALLRIVVGAWFFKSLFTKLTLGFAWIFPVPAASNRWIATMPQLVAKYAAENPFPWYQHFLIGSVIPNATIFASLTAVGEVAVGFSLLFGLLTPVGAFFALIQVVFYGLAVQHTSPGQQGFHIVLFAMLLTFLLSRAGRFWGVDGWMRKHWPTSSIVRLLT